MSDILEKLTKEDLIKVIATMQEIIVDWNRGFTHPSEADTLTSIGVACIQECVKNNDWDLPEF